MKPTLKKKIKVNLYDPHAKPEESLNQSYFRTSNDASFQSETMDLSKSLTALPNRSRRQIFYK
jgi:hypothetical protein